MFCNRILGWVLTIVAIPAMIMALLVAGIAKPVSTKDIQFVRV